MEDWTDIIAEELKDIEEPLPAGDWDVMHRKYEDVRRRRKIVLWWRAGAVASVAAVLAVLLLVFRGNPADEPDVPVYSEAQIEVMPSVAADDVPVSATVEDVTVENLSRPSDTSGKTDPVIMPENQESSDDSLPSSSAEPSVPSAPAQPSAPAEPADLIADAGNIWDDDPVEPRRRIRMSLGAGATGGLAGGNVIPRFTMIEPEPVDSTDITVFDPDMGNVPVKSASYRSRQLKKTKHQHYMPVSVGVSARFAMSERFFLNTGFNYTLYTSKVTRIYDGGWTENLKQSVHYIGIPFRGDWMLMDKPGFDMYLGVGGQVEKCVYAKLGAERLHEKDFLWSAGVSFGIQYGITSRTSLFFEPEISAKLNRGDLQTYRTEKDVMITARAGIRIDM